MTATALAARHELRAFPTEYAFASRARRQELLTEWMLGLDAIVGPLNSDVVHARREMSRRVPWAAFVLGALPRGAFGLSVAHRYIYTSDVLICNCTADVVLAKKFFPNANVRLVPFAYHDSTFYPAGDEARHATREALGLEPHDRVVIYAGRFTIEKNVHSVLKTFCVVLDAVPSAKLLLAGDEMRAPFSEFGVLPVSTKRLLRRTRTELGLDGPRVMLIGQRTAGQLRDLYSAADVLLNLTLHHDENFGLAQVEAMACGLPVVGSAWGGLKDTILDGLTGTHVPALVTRTGVKVDWWTAANRVVQLLSGEGPTAEMRQRCSKHARDTYSLNRYCERLDEALLDCVRLGERPVTPLQRSSFADQYWSICANSPEEPPPYRRGAEAMRLYRELITPYAATPAADIQSDAESAWCLATALSITGDSATIQVNDPIFPFEVTPPYHLAGAIRALAIAFTEQPVQEAESAGFKDSPAREGLSWMHEHGLVLRTCRGSFTPNWARLPIGRPTFRLHRVDHETDIVWFA